MNYRVFVSLGLIIKNKKLCRTIYKKIDDYTPVRQFELSDDSITIIDLNENRRFYNLKYYDLSRISQVI